ncbi:efflux RND transporter permease subunit [uncultured Pseudoteredinibacter sp.]|uniref:efflux RND transporter permease subunit n=1 Tax=uncultured Pseudoteredinibacter sp. TaxID=1641701 RepID=UPI00261C0E39|nr:efflux RND transporter permease subunit [uncultured Pseudoteredinibacter sp.]
MNDQKRASLILTCTLLIILSGIVAAFSLPNSLLPDLSRPQIELFSRWPGKTARQIEQSLIAPLEQQLRGIAEMSEMRSDIRAGNATTTLTFQSAADMNQAYINVLSASNQVPSWPSQVAKPLIRDYSNGAGATLASFFVYHKNKSQSDPNALIDAYKQYIEPAFAKIKGVSGAVVGTPVERRINIELDPERLSQNSLEQPEIVEKLRGFSDQSGGKLTFGAREYDLQFKGQLSFAQLSTVPITANEQHIIRLGDIANIQTELSSPWDYFALEGKPSFYFFVQPSSGINALNTIARIKQTITELNNGPLHSRGIELAISRDDSLAITNALQLVYGSLILGMLLACAVLYYFLRNHISVGLTFLSIPFCLSIVVLLMSVSGYSFNVISLAGIALSIGLIMDAAIIVIEALNRSKQQKLSLAKTLKELRSALFSSTLSSIIVFLPMLFMSSIEGKLFQDLAFTISAALAASAVFALWVLPILYQRLMPSKNWKTSARANKPILNNEPDLAQAPSKPPTIKSPAKNTFKKKLATLLTLGAHNRTAAICLLLLSIPIATFVIIEIRPAIDVLPDPKQNIMSSFIRFEEPLSKDTVREEYAKLLADRIERELQQSIDLGIRTYGLFCFPNRCQLYFHTNGKQKFSVLKEWLESRVTVDLVGTSVFTVQGSLLRFALPNNRSTWLDIKGADLPQLQKAGLGLLQYLKAKHPKARIEEATPLINRSTQVEFTAKRDQLIHLGLSPEELKQRLLVLSDGMYLGDFYINSATLPLYLKSKQADYLDELLDTEIYIRHHGLVPLRQLSNVKIKSVPDSIFRVNGEVASSISVTPPDGTPMGKFSEQLQRDVAEYMEAKHPHLHLSYRGSADQLGAFLQEFVAIFLIAVALLAVLMQLTLGSWKFALAVLLSMPLAILGGMLNLKLLSLFVPQNLDIITMIGFVILMGLVINNAILLVSQYQQAALQGQSQREAILSAVFARKQAIYLSASTSILGMLPLMINPASSAEIYRGLAAVICGGMLFSALFGISFMSALLSLPFFKNSKAPSETAKLPHAQNEAALPI